MIAIKTVNGVAPTIEPLQDGYSTTKSDLYSESTGRSAETGHLLRYTIRTGIVTIELHYEGTIADIASMESLLSASTMTVEYYDNGSYVTKNFYPSDRQKKTKSLRGAGWASLAVTLVEI